MISHLETENIVFFFFSSRRRHTRYWRDWSSDVCSSDLFRIGNISASCVVGPDAGGFQPPHKQRQRSEERRVGKECRSRWSPDHLKKKNKILYCSESKHIYNTNYLL